MRHAAALDVGGTKLAAAVVDEDGRILRRARRPTPRTEDAEALWAATAAVLDDVVGGTEAVCGVGCGGPMAGDLVYYPGHVMMYLGVPDTIVHAPYTGRNVEVDFAPKHRNLRYGNPIS